MPALATSIVMQLPIEPGTVVWSEGHPFVCDHDPLVRGHVRWLGQVNGTPVALTPAELSARMWELPKDQHRPGPTYRPTGSPS